MSLDAQFSTRPGPGGFEVTANLCAGAEVIALLGPNGAGKTTILRALAGLIPLSSGRIRIGSQVVADAAAGIDLPPQERRIGLVFQDHRLFPSMSALDNVAFAARMRGIPRPAARAAAQTWLERFDLANLAQSRPGRLSGGQAQRVALARALAADPALLLLDEPMAALDAQARGAARAELSGFVRDFTGTTLLVSHDPLDALALADRIVVLQDGRIVQDAQPGVITRRPATPYVARLMGLNLYAGHQDPVTGTVTLDGGGHLTGPVVPGAARVLLALRPSAITAHRERPGELSSRNVWPGRVTELQLLGDRVRVAVDGQPAALVDLTPAAVHELGLGVGSPIWLSAKATEVEAYPGELPER